jgi:hypothetical protein
MSQPKNTLKGTVREVMTNKELTEAGVEKGNAIAPQSVYGGQVMNDLPWSVEDLQKVDDFDAVLAMVEEAYGDVVDATAELGDGFRVLTREEKERMVGIPLVLMHWKFSESDYQRPDTDSYFVIVRCAAKHRNAPMGKYVITDGGTGLARQLLEYTQRTGRQGGLVLRKGLLRSDYDTENGPATTMYLDVSPDGDLPF